MFCTLGCDKVSMLTQTCPHKCLREIKVSICNHQVDGLFFLWPDVCFHGLQSKKKKSMVMHGTKCLFWNQMSSNTLLFNGSELLTTLLRCTCCLVSWTFLRCTCFLVSWTLLRCTCCLVSWTFLRCTCFLVSWTLLRCTCCLVSWTSLRCIRK